MKIKSIQIKNYKSIKDLTFNINDNLKEQSYIFVGINEAGKSSFLEALSFFDDGVVIDSKFYNDKNKDIEIILEYDQNELEKNIKKFLNEKSKEEGLKSIDKGFINQIKLKQFKIKRVFEKDSKGVLNFDEITFENENIENYFIDEDNILTKKAIKQPETENQENDSKIINIKDFLEKLEENYFYNETHKFTFWKSSKKYLINESINLDDFSNDPENISIPLMNCFSLVDVEEEDILEKIKEIKKDNSEQQNFIDKLNNNITKHIKSIWEDHKVRIKFNIDSNILNFLIEDEDVSYSNKDIEQRSDGFRHFISFLLTISAENETNKLENTILLLDEPEQHLHPKAINFLRDELIKITKNNNNLVFLATHSIFMIDEFNLKRNYKVNKKNNKKTEIENVGENETFSNVIYNVFDIYTSDLHNELYGWIEDFYRSNFKEKETDEKYNFDEFLATKLNKKDKLKKYKNIKDKTKSNISLHTYIRNQIHHPENTKNVKYTKKELERSIEDLIKLKSDLSKAKN